MKIKRVLIIIGCVLLLLGSGYMTLLYMVGKAFEGIGESMARGIGISHLNNLENGFFQEEEKFNEIDSVMQEMIRSNPEGVLNDSAKQIFKLLFTELYPYRRAALPIYFYLSLFR